MRMAAGHRDAEIEKGKRQREFEIWKWQGEKRLGIEFPGLPLICISVSLRLCG